LAPIRLSTAEGWSKYPCITQHFGEIYSVWQRETHSNYEIYFASSQDGGNTWGNIYVLATTQSLSVNDPLPVIQASVTAQNRIVVVFHDNSALISYITNSIDPWPNEWDIVQIPYTDGNDYWPSLTGAGSTSMITGLAYGNTQGEIHYRYHYPATGGWSAPMNLSVIVPGSNYFHETPTLSCIPNSSNMHIAWHRIRGSGSSIYDHTLIHRKSISYNNWPSEYTMLYYSDQRLPSITAIAWNKVYIFFQTAFQDIIGKQFFNGYSWSAPSDVAYSSRYPSVSTGSTSAKYVYDHGFTVPYTVEFGTETLHKTTGSKDNNYSRSISMDG
jgi:hypothetical protein